MPNGRRARRRPQGALGRDGWPEISSYDWWLIGLAVDGELSRAFDTYPARPIAAHLRALLEKVRICHVRQEAEELPDRQKAELLDDSPF
jgi:hypothetical protein